MVDAMRFGPTETLCRRCDETKPYKGGEVDVEDYPDGDEDYRQREVFICADCLQEAAAEYEAKREIAMERRSTPWEDYE